MSGEETVSETTPQSQRFSRHDIAEIAIGCYVMAFPVAFPASFAATVIDGLR